MKRTEWHKHREEHKAFHVHIKEDYALMKLLRNVVLPLYRDRLVGGDNLLDVLSEFFNVDTRRLYWAIAQKDIKIKGEAWRHGFYRDYRVKAQLIPKRSIFVIRYDETDPDNIDIEYVNKNKQTSIVSLTRTEWSCINKKVQVIINPRGLERGTREYKQIVSYYRSAAASDLGCSAQVTTRWRLVFRRGNLPKGPTTNRRRPSS